MEKVRVYELVDAEIIRNQAPWIYSTLFDLPNDRRLSAFSVSPISGWIYYANNAELRKNPLEDGLRNSSSEIENYCKIWLENCAEKHKKSILSGSLNEYIPALFPTTIKLVDIQPVFAPPKTTVDHWLVRFHIYNRVSDEFGSTNVPIFGSGIDIRLGVGGKVLLFSQRWRPYSKVISSDFLSYAETSLSQIHSHVHNHTSHKSEPELMYFLKGQSIHQSHLAPYHAIADGHHLEFNPASIYSLRIDFDKTLYRDNMEIKARISGGSGRYTYEWGSWLVGEGMAAQYIHRGNTDRLRLEGGVHQLLLIVKDEITKVTDQKIETIYSKYPTSEPPSRERWGCTDPLALNYDANANCDDESCVYQTV